MDLRRLRAGEYLLAASGAALLVTLFLPWYEGDPDTLTGWEALGLVDVVLALIAVSALAVVAVTAFQRVPAVPIALDAIITPVGLAAAVLVLIRVLALPDGATGREPALWVALAAAAGIVAGGVLAMRDERVAPPDRYTDATGRPVPKPPDVEPLPAPPPGGAS